MSRFIDWIFVACLAMMLVACEDASRPTPDPFVVSLPADLTTKSQHRLRLTRIEVVNVLDGIQSENGRYLVLRGILLQGDADGGCVTARQFRLNTGYDLVVPHIMQRKHLFAAQAHYGVPFPGVVRGQCPPDDGEQTVLVFDIPIESENVQLVSGESEIVLGHMPLITELGVVEPGFEVEAAATVPAESSAETAQGRSQTDTNAVFQTVVSAEAEYVAALAVPLYFPEGRRMEIEQIELYTKMGDLEPNKGTFLLLRGHLFASSTNRDCVDSDEIGVTLGTAPPKEYDFAYRAAEYVELHDEMTYPGVVFGVCPTDEGVPLFVVFDIPVDAEAVWLWSATDEILLGDIADITEFVAINTDTSE